MLISASWLSELNQWATYVTLTLLIFHLLGIVYSIHVIRNQRSSQGAVAWMGGLLVFPVVAVPLYMLAGRTRYENFLNARHTLKDELSEMYAKLADAIGDYQHQTRSKLIQDVSKVVKLESTSGNSYQLLIDGEEKFEKVFKELKTAENYIFVEYYTINDDDIGKKFKDALIEQVERGVKVYILYDSFGSMGMSGSYIKELEAAGVHCKSFGIKKKMLSRFQLNFRNHRKIIVIDGKKAFTGGINVGDEYLGRDVDLGDWRDTHLYYEGPAALCAQGVFLEDWYWGNGEKLEADWIVPSTDSEGDSSAKATLAVCEMGPADDFATWRMVIVLAAAQAREKLWIASPYLAPDEGTLTALKVAALRGVDVRIIYPMKGDETLVRFAGYTFQKDLIPAGVKIYKYNDGFMHQKVMLVDDETALVGSANLDYRSMKLNFEVNVMTDDKKLILEIDEMLVNDITKCKKLEVDELEGKGFWFTTYAYFARLFLPIL